MKAKKNSHDSKSLPIAVGRFFETAYAEYQQPLDPDETDRVQLVARRMHPTVQEHVVGSILNSLELRYCPQWVWQTPHEPFIFDFLIEPRWVLECTLSQRQCARTKHWLKERATVFERKFKELKRRLPHLFTVMFLEAPNCRPKALHAHIVPILEYTNTLITDLDDFEGFARQWKQSQTKAGRDQWLQSIQRLPPSTSTPDDEIHGRQFR